MQRRTVISSPAMDPLVVPNGSPAGYESWMAPLNNRAAGRLRRKRKRAVDPSSKMIVSYLAIAFLLVIIVSCLGMYVFLLEGVFGAPNWSALFYGIWGFLLSRFGWTATSSIPFPPPFPIITRNEGGTLSKDALEMCTRTLWHTVETTTIVLPNAETFIHTGDINDLWLLLRVPTCTCIKYKTK